MCAEEWNFGLSKLIPGYTGDHEITIGFANEKERMAGAVLYLVLEELKRSGQKIPITDYPLIPSAEKIKHADGNISSLVETFEEGDLLADWSKVCEKINNANFSAALEVYFRTVNPYKKALYLTVRKKSTGTETRNESKINKETAKSSKE